MWPSSDHARTDWTVKLPTARQRRQPKGQWKPEAMLLPSAPNLGGGVGDRSPTRDAIAAEILKPVHRPWRGKGERSERDIIEKGITSKHCDRLSLSRCLARPVKPPPILPQVSAPLKRMWRGWHERTLGRCPACGSPTT